MQLDSNFYLEHLCLGESVLGPEESLHISKSFRARAGDSLVLCDGKGRFANAELAEVAPKACKVLITSISNNEPAPQVHLAIGCLSDGSEEDIVFHAAQMPIAAIHLLRTERSQEPKNSDLSRLRRRMEAKSLAALKQSRKPWLTEIKGPVYLNEFLENFKGNLIVCDENGDCMGNSPWLPIQSPTAILTGPEGGFSAAEIEAMKNKGALFLSLGPTRLRAVTAPIVALGKLF